MQNALAQFLGQQIQDLRKDAGYTQEQLAQETFMSPRGIQKIEAGETLPKYETLFKIAECLEIDPTIIVKSLWELWKSEQS